MPPVCVRPEGSREAGTYYQGPNMLQEILSFCQQYHYLSDVQINPLTPAQFTLLRASVSNLV